MGQTLGKAPIPKCTRFVNLPKRCVYELWSAYNDIAEGFGLTIEEFAEIVKSATLEYLLVTERVLAPEIDALFRALDDDENKLVDSLEFIAALAMLSGMTAEEKIRFVFAMFDFDESGMLTLDEMVLAFRSCLSGACKICKIEPPLEEDIESTVTLGFDLLRQQLQQQKESKSSAGKSNKNKLDNLEIFSGIDRESFVHFSLTTPDVSAWIDYFDDLHDYAVREERLAVLGSVNDPYQQLLVTTPPLHTHTYRDSTDEAHMHLSWSAGALLRSEIDTESAQPAPQKPWRNVVNTLNQLTVHNSTPQSRSVRAPKNLEIDWVYGYNGHSSRQNLLYGLQGEVIYPAGAVVVIQRIASHSQSHFVQHSDLVSALTGFKVTFDREEAKNGESKSGDSLSPSITQLAQTSAASSGNTIVATGELGVHPTIFVWETNTLTVLSTLRGFHRGGVDKLDFSPNRELLVTMGMDPYHSIAVYTWVNGNRVWCSRSTCYAVHDLRFLSDRVFACCGERHMLFFSSPSAVTTDISRATFKRYRGQGTSYRVEENTFRVLGSVGESVVYSGNDGGFIQVWEGRNWVRNIKAHSGAVTATTAMSSRGVVTACAQGKVLVWNENLEITASFSAGMLGPLSLSVVAVAFENLANKFLIATASNEIFEMDATDGRNAHSGGAIVNTHARERVTGLATHPYQAHIVCTVGNDCTLRLFDTQAHKQLRAVTLDCVPHCCTFTHDGMGILVGVGIATSTSNRSSVNDSSASGKVNGKNNEYKEKKEGLYMMINAEDLTIVHEARDSKRCINTVCVSPDGECVAMGSADGLLYLYRYAQRNTQAQRRLEMYALCRGHTGEVLCADFSTTGACVRSNSSTGELFFWDTKTGEMLAPKAVKSMSWETQRCVYSPTTQHFPAVLTEHSPRAVRCVSVCKTHSDDCLFFALSSGALTLTPLPCYYEERVLPDLAYYYAHAKGIACVDVSCDDRSLFTSGERDGCLVQWRMSVCESAVMNEDVKRFEVIAPSMLAEIAFDGKALDISSHHEASLLHSFSFVADLEEGRVPQKQAQAWQKKIVSPTRPLRDDPSPPPDALRLEYVYGYAHDVCRRGIAYVGAVGGPHHSQGEFCFFLGNIAVVMHPLTRTQRFYRGHTARITAMAVCETHAVVATGEQCKLPRIHIWESESLAPRCVLWGTARNGIKHLQFTSDGQHLLALSQDATHTLSVYDWQRETLLVCTPTFAQTCYDVSFAPSASAHAQHTFEVVQCGQEVIRFWRLCGRNATYEDAVLTSRAKRQGFLCVAFLGSNAVVGCMDGNLYRFLGNKLESIVSAHTAAVHSLVCSSARDALVSVSADGSLRVWTRFLECRLIVEARSLHSVSTQLRCVAWDDARGSLLVGTAASEIFEISAADGDNKHAKGALLEGHGTPGCTSSEYNNSATTSSANASTKGTGYASDLSITGEVWGLAVNPAKEDEFATVGDDALLRIWNLTQYRTVHTVALEMPARCVAFSPDGKHIAVGYGAPPAVTSFMPGRTFEGKWAVLDVLDLAVSHEARDAQRWLRELVYSPDGVFIAIASEDTRVYVYNVTEGYNCCAVISQFSSPVQWIDFSADSAWLRANCLSGELCYFESETGLYIPSPARLRDVTWATQRCAMEYTTQGLWSPYSDGVEYTSCEVNLFRGEGDTGSDGAVIVAGDSLGRLSITRYPSLNATLACTQQYWAAASAVRRVCFANGDAVLLCVTGRDKGVLQWRHVRDREEGVVSTPPRETSLTPEEEAEISARTSLFYADSSLRASEEVVEEELRQLVSVRPYMGAIVPPSSVAQYLETQQYYTSPIPSLLMRDHVIGLQCQLTRQHVFYNANANILGPTSQYVTIYDKALNAQKIYDLHEKAEVCCITVSKNGRFVATAERGLRPCVRVWDALTGAALSVLPSTRDIEPKQDAQQHRQGVLSLEFSPSGSVLLSLGADSARSLSVHRSLSHTWRDGDALCVCATQRTDTAHDGVLFAALCEEDALAHTQSQAHAQAQSVLCVTGGREHIRFWMCSGNTLTAVYPQHSEKVRLGSLLCGKFVPSTHKLVTGSLSGHLLVWRGRRLERVVRAHERGVTAICVTTPSLTLPNLQQTSHSAPSSSTGPSSSALVPTNRPKDVNSISLGSTFIVTGSQEGVVKVWTAELEHLKTLSLSDADVPPLLSCVRSVDCALDTQGQVSAVCVSTAAAEVYEAFVLSGRVQLVSEAHFDGELHGLCMHPKEPDTFLTCGDDCSVRVWSVSEKRLLRKAVIDCTARACAWSPNGAIIVIGLGGRADGSRQRKDGAFLVLEGNTLKPRYEGRDSRHPITDIKFSPDGTVFATASADHQIYIYRSDAYQLRATCDGHTAAIATIDFSRDSRYLRSDSRDYTLLYHESSDGALCAAASQLRDLAWSDPTSLFSWATQGVWPARDDEGRPVVPEPVCGHRSPDSALFVVGDALGDLRIYRYPCLNREANYISYKAHVGPVAKVRFTNDMKYVVSIGQKDRAICVWRLLPREIDSLGNAVDNSANSANNNTQSSKLLGRK